MNRATAPVPRTKSQIGMSLAGRAIRPPRGINLQPPPLGSVTAVAVLRRCYAPLLLGANCWTAFQLANTTTTGGKTTINILYNVGPLFTHSSTKRLNANAVSIPKEK